MPLFLAINFNMHQEFESPPALQDSIKCFWYNKRCFEEKQTSFDVIPDGYAEIIFYFGSLSGISYDGNLQALPSPFMMGLLNHPAVFYTKNQLEIIGVRCFPWTVFNLLGLPSGKGGVQVFEHPIALLQPMLNELVLNGRIEEAITLVKEYFLKKIFFYQGNSFFYSSV